PHRARDTGAVRQESHHGERERGLARPRLPDDAEHLARPGREARPAHGAHAGRVPNREIRDPQNAQRPSPAGSRASRRPSPRRFTARTTRTSSPAANPNGHGWAAAVAWPSAISVPSDTSGGRTPNPR